MSAFASTLEVYPRPRGGTFVSALYAPGTRGLSPPTRGNPRYHVPADTGNGSIPAHAGEPTMGLGAVGSCSVYPRPRGGTAARGASLLDDNGLSPPTRGNPRARSWTNTSMRSIPAHAGEPAPTQSSRSRAPVYPRPRGGTIVVVGIDYAHRGLSPPTRGNLRIDFDTTGIEGSIPAHAGEPSAD